MFDILVNPIAGKGKSLKALKKVKSILQNNNKNYKIHFSDSVSHTTEITKTLNSEQKDTKLIVLGGDGTYNEVINGIIDFDNITVGFIPCGTGNDFIRSTTISNDIPFTMKAILEDQTQFMDYIQLETRRALNCAGAGMDVDTLIRYGEMKFFKGKIKYYAALIATLLHLKFHKIEMTINGDTSIHEVFMVVVANGTHIGGGMPVSPKSVPNDNSFEIIVINKIKPSKILPLLLKFLKGKHLNEDCTECYAGADVSIKLLDSNKTQVDGEVFESNNINCQLVSNKLKVFAK